MKPSDAHSDLQMLDSGDVMSLFRLSKSTLWRHVKDGKLPSPIYLGRTPLWHKKTLERWLHENCGKTVVVRTQEIDELC